jgi:hypothetical protein
MLLYQFRNNSDKDCTVEVRQQAWTHNPEFPGNVHSA